MTLVGWINFLVLQWFGVRLARTYRKLPVGVVQTVALRMIVEGQIVTTNDVREVGPVRVPHGWKLLRWVWPLTGWWSDFRWIARRP